MLKKIIIAFVSLIALVFVTIIFNPVKKVYDFKAEPLNELTNPLNEVTVNIPTELVKEDQFDEFNNETGSSVFIVPNIIHYIRFNNSELNFVDYICMRSAYVNHQPDLIYIHTDVKELTGKYWKNIQDEPDFYSRIQILYLEAPSEIFGQRLSEGWRFYHGSDVARIRTLMKYGGIYLDNDVYVVQNLDKYRKFEIAIGWDENQFLGSQVIIAHSQARFLQLWLDTYHEYYSDRWYYNAGERPTVEVLYKKPELVHRVKIKFGVHYLIGELYTTMWNEWRRQDTIHLLMGHRSYLDPHYKEYESFNENNIQSYNYTFGIMAREVMKSNIME